jgi:hypothetical protein
VPNSRQATVVPEVARSHRERSATRRASAQRRQVICLVNRFQHVWHPVGQVFNLPCWPEEFGAGCKPAPPPLCLGRARRTRSPSYNVWHPVGQVFNLPGWREECWAGCKPVPPPLCLGRARRTRSPSYNVCHPVGQVCNLPGWREECWAGCKPAPPPLCLGRARRTRSPSYKVCHPVGQVFNLPGWREECWAGCKPAPPPLCRRTGSPSYIGSRRAITRPIPWSSCRRPRYGSGVRKCGPCRQPIGVDRRCARDPLPSTRA